MEAEQGVVASSAFAITSDGAQGPFVLPLPRHQPTTDAGPQRQDSPTMVASQQDGPMAVVAHLDPATEAPTSGETPDVVKKKKKKRGRPKKYGPDGSVVALSPMPISASIPLDGESSEAWRGGSVESIKKKQKRMALERRGEKIAYLVGANFTPHVLKINPGEDVTTKIMSFSEQASRAVCILSANGTISNVTLRQPTSLGGTLTYEGRFEILSLSGSHNPVESGGTTSRSSGMSVSLAGPDGRVIGGGLAGLLVAAGPVQVVLGSFLPGHKLERKPKKIRADIPAVMPPVISNVSTQDEMSLGLYSGDEPLVSPAPAFQGEASVPFLDVQNTTQTRDSFGIKESNRLVS